MIEALKSLLLVLLVAASLVQSYMLVFGSPKFDDILPSEDYVESELKGTSAELSELIYPKDILLHFGDGQHTVLYPKMVFYDMILEVVEQRTFDGLRSAGGFTPLNEAGAGAAQGIEIRFAEELNVSLLRLRMNLKSDGQLLQEPIDRIHIFTRPEREDVRVFFTGSRSGAAYEATRADFTVKDVERFVGFGETLPRFARLPGSAGHYVPDDPLPMVRYRVEFSRFTADQLQRSLFPDPFNTRNLTERGGSEIYTDGKRGLQLRNDDLWMSYTDPAASSDGRQAALDSALSAVQFVNRHGGWNGDYVLERLRQDAGGTEWNARFRQYVGNFMGAYPIVGMRDGSPFGPIELKLRGRIVTGYERSMAQLSLETASREAVKLPGGEQLLAAWTAYADRGRAVSLYPAYVAMRDGDEMVLEPVWAMTMQDGTTRILPGGGAY